MQHALSSNVSRGLVSIGIFWQLLFLLAFFLFAPDLGSY
jgi:hypothetical protein